MLLCPCFLEAGRLTIDDVQWVAQDDDLVPSAQTTYATDRSFGYSVSNLRSWVEEKTGGAVRAADVLSLGLEDIRRGGPERVREILGEAEGRRPVVVNATEYADLEVVVLGLLEAEAAGQDLRLPLRPVVRARARRHRAGAAAERRTRSTPAAPRTATGSCWSARTWRRRRASSSMRSRSTGCTGRSCPSRGCSTPTRASRRSRTRSSAIEQHLPEREVILYTSRELARAEGSDEALDVGRSVSDALVELVQRLDPGLPLAFCVAKGGITSSDIGTRGFGVRRAEVAGQMLPGTISVWMLPDDSAFPGLPYVIFPGNVGEAETLAEVIERLAT